MQSEEGKAVQNLELKKKDLSLSFEEIGGYALPIVFYIVVAFTLFYTILHGFSSIIFSWSISNMLLWSLPFLIGGIILHELIHGVCFSVFSGKPLSFIKYGFDRKTFTPYAHCKTPISASAYKIGALMPAIALGFIPYIFSLFTGNIYLFMFGTFFTTAACGDFIIFWIIRNVDNSSLVEDHPSKAGCYIYSDNSIDISNNQYDAEFAYSLHRQYKIPFLLLLLASGAIFGYRIASVIGQML